MRAACIDIGTNTTRLLVAERAGGGLREIAADRRFTRLGAGRAADGALAGERIAEVAAVVGEQVRLAAGAGAQRTRAVATAAIRRAPNRDALVAAVRAASGLSVEVLSGEAEARLAFLGAVRCHGRPPDGEVAVVDVGGGSTEIAVGTASTGARWWRSLEVGSGVLAEAHLRSDPPAPAELDAARAAAAAAFAGLDEPPRFGGAVAVGGSAASLRRVVGERLDEEALQAAVALLASEHSTEIARRLELDPRRVRLMPAGLVVLAAAAERLGRPLELGFGGLREGVVLELLGEGAL